MKKYISILLLLGLVFSCSSGSKKKTKFLYVDNKVEVLYNAALDALAKNRYGQAIAYFSEVDRQHPYSDWARRSLLMSAYAKYSSSDFEESRGDLERFISLHPGNENAPYAYYLLAMSYYKQMYDVGRDQTFTQLAFDAFQNLVHRFPNSDFAKDARIKRDICIDQLAGKEMEVGRFYARKNMHIAAIKRFNRVLDYYNITQQMPEALHRLVESYLQIGLLDEARRNAATLSYNYGNSKWYKRTFSLFKEKGLLLKNELTYNSQYVNKNRHSKDKRTDGNKYIDKEIFKQKR